MTALIGAFKKEMLERGFEPHHLVIKADLGSGAVTLVKSDDACKRQSEVLDYIKEQEIDGIDTYTHDDVMELSSDFVGDKVMVGDVDELDGNSDWYVDLLYYWTEAFSHIVVEIAMRKYFNDNK